jgi:hypothetical protein
MAGATFYLLMIFVVLIIDIALLVAMILFRQQSKNCNENPSVFCPVVICGDGSSPVAVPVTATA